MHFSENSHLFIVFWVYLYLHFFVIAFIFLPMDGIGTAGNRHFQAIFNILGIIKFLK